jgi:putative membrane protein
MHTIRFSRLSSAGLAALATAFAASLAGAQVTTTSGGDVATFSQKNLVNHLIVGDSIEVEMAQLAASRTQNAAVRDFANQLLTDHKAHLETLTKLAGKSDIGREANPSDTSGAHLAGLLAGLKSMAADSGFDRAFVQDQIEHHQATINGLKAMRSAAKDDDVQKDIDATLPVLEKHLSSAQQLAAQLNKPGAPATPAAAPQKPDSTAAAAAKPPVSKPPVAKPPV